MKKSREPFDILVIFFGPDPQREFYSEISSGFCFTLLNRNLSKTMITFLLRFFYGEKKVFPSFILHVKIYYSRRSGLEGIKRIIKVVLRIVFILILFMI